MQKMDGFIDIAENMQWWDGAVKIYDDAFPEWEKEDIDHILKNIENGRYKMVAYLSNNKVEGIYILDINHQLDYALFSFLAVDTALRGQKIGTMLCAHAINYFQNHVSCQWLFIEAEDRQCKFYSKFGFKKLQIKYNVPKFNSSQSIAMHLMCIDKNKRIDSESLKNIIEHIFVHGYCLPEDDQRIQKQLERIPVTIDAMASRS
ncbi:MAG: GNAT family N-acetyltransferase [Epsilonproteobacteria bacterium]|nr:GNAT family N-acetyltransferase [Campylobacterota bacterium]